jgi:hypothetical protein
MLNLLNFRCTVKGGVGGKSLKWTRTVLLSLGTPSNGVSNLFISTSLYDSAAIPPRPWYSFECMLHVIHRYNQELIDY